jgi:hypothetical protein
MPTQPSSRPQPRTRDGPTIQAIVEEFPGIEPDDVRACIAYGARLADMRCATLNGEADRYEDKPPVGLRCQPVVGPVSPFGTIYWGPGAAVVVVDLAGDVALGMRMISRLLLPSAVRRST